MKKLVDIKELKANHSDVYDAHYQKYCTMQWEWPLEESFYVDGLNEDHKWLNVDKIHYSVGYCQSDYAYFTGWVDLTKFLEEFDTEGEYFVLREAIKLADADGKLVIWQNRRWGESVHFDNIEWLGWETIEDNAAVQSFGDTRSILEGMNYGEYIDLCQELIRDLEAWVKGKCEGLFNDLYYKIRDEIDYQMSEEAFEEWAESMDEQFEVEVDNDEPRDADHSEAARLAA